MVWWTCSREEMTLPSWTSSTMVRTWRVVTAAGDRNSEVGRGQETLVQSPAPEHGGSPPPTVSVPLQALQHHIHTQVPPSLSTPFHPIPLLMPLCKSCLPGVWLEPHTLCPSARQAPCRMGATVGSVSCPLQSPGHELGSCLPHQTGIWRTMTMSFSPIRPESTETGLLWLVGKVSQAKA